jgi:alpha-tubulin suppressor-like RCC1 family protein
MSIHGVSVGIFSQLFLTSQGRYGRLGHGSQEIVTSPRVIEFENPLELAPEEKIETSLIACGWSHSIIIRKSNITNKTFLYTFGKGDNGQVGKFLGNFH